MTRACRRAKAGGLAALCGLALASAATASEECAPEAGSAHAVERVLDGETLLLDDGREVRLMGALAPGPEAARALEALIAGRRVALRHEGRRYDRYGRTLAQLYVDGPDGAAWVQQRLVAEGHARAYALPGSTGCLAELTTAEDEARRARRGLWSRDAFRVRAAAEVAALLRLAGRFAIVEGRVAKVSRTRRTVYINFGDDWRRDFTASLATAVVDKSAGAAERLAALEGKEVRVRGWIERRNGPMIVLASPDEIEVLEGNR